MSTPITFNSVSYLVPAYNDAGYAQGAGNLSAYLIAVSTGTLQPSGGTFTLTADVNFGANFGLLSKYFTAITTNPATAGAVRLAKTDTMSWRNNANSGNLPLGIDSSNRLTYNSVPVMTTQTVRTPASVTADGIGTAFSALGVDVVTINVGVNAVVNGPTGGADGQKLLIRMKSSGSFSVTLSTGSGNFRFGTDITSYVSTSSATDYLGVVYNSVSSTWDVVSIIHGY